MDKLNLPYQKEINHPNDVINAWYDLLCTSTKKGQTLLDILANRGYFTQFYKLNLAEPIFFNGKAQPVPKCSSCSKSIMSGIHPSLCKLYI